MGITLNRLNESDRFLELGAGEHPTVHPHCLGGPDVAVDVRSCFNEQGQPTIDFQMDVEQIPWPIGSDEFDGLVAHFVLEHVGYPCVPEVLKEALRVLKPGCKVVIAVPNTDAQIKWIQTHSEGWDGKDAFESCSEVLFGTQNERTAGGHQSYWNPAVAIKLFRDAGFDQVKTFPYGERATDMVIEAVKPVSLKYGDPGWEQYVRSEQFNHDQELKGVPYSVAHANQTVEIMKLEGRFNETGIVPSGTTESSSLVTVEQVFEPCNSFGPNGVHCVKPKGHAGKHAAEAV